MKDVAFVCVCDVIKDFGEVDTGLGPDSLRRCAFKLGVGDSFLFCFLFEGKGKWKPFTK